LFSKEEVLKIASLSRIYLSDEEATLFSGQLQNILNYVEQISAADVEGIEALGHPTKPAGEPTPLREDEPWESLGSEKILESAPKQKSHCYEVPTVI